MYSSVRSLLLTVKLDALRHCVGRNRLTRMSFLLANESTAHDHVHHQQARLKYFFMPAVASLENKTATYSIVSSSLLSPSPSVIFFPFFLLSQLRWNTSLRSLLRAHAARRHQCAHLKKWPALQRTLSARAIITSTRRVRQRACFSIFSHSSSVIDIASSHFRSMETARFAATVPMENWPGSVMFLVERRKY